MLSERVPSNDRGSVVFLFLAACVVAVVVTLAYQAGFADGEEDSRVVECPTKTRVGRAADKLHDWNGRSKKNHD